MAVTLNPPPLTGDANLDRWLNLLRKVVLAQVGPLGSYANDAAAASGGVAVGDLYRNGSAVMIRVT